MNTGEVLAYQNLPALFTVVNFVTAEALQPLVDILPDEPPTDPRNLLAHVRDFRALDTASGLQQMLISFHGDAVNMGQSALQYFDQATRTVAHATKPVYMSLEQIANRVLPDFMKIGGNLPPHALYAMHLALHRESWGARPVNLRWHRRNYIYEIQPLSDIELLTQIIPKVRKLVDGAALRDNPSKSASLLRSNDLGRFITKARAAVESSRTRRQWTPYGMIGPSSEPVREFPEWTTADLAFIRFMELWACRRLSPDPSLVDSLASTILRLTRMYEGAEWVAHWTGFTFLQEIGWIPPWEIPARYDYRFPDTTVSRGQALVRPPVDVESSLRDDIAADARKDWGDARIFCVDWEHTADVDDGFSLERIEQTGSGSEQFWIHIHIADPASRIDPKSALASYLQDIPLSLYLAGFWEKMMPAEVERQFTLNPGVPALTFSARVTSGGEVLEHKVEPGTIHNVVHMTKEAVSSILPDEPSSSESSDPPGIFTVGSDDQLSARSPVKKITSADELTQGDKDDLLLLHQLGKALRDRRAEKGQLPQVTSRQPSLEVSLGHVTVEAGDADAESSVAWGGDPVIKLSQPVTTQADLLVERMMHTAGEVAATWCQERNIPVPFSTQPDAPRNAAELETLRREVIDPLTSAGQPLPPDLLNRLFALIGTSELSSRPGPFYSVGVDAYAKASSPLRRYTDLVVHWQIHAALAHERETGESLVGSDCSAAPFLPWTRDELDPLLPILQARQRQIREVDNRNGPQQWLFQALLRAWKFGEAPLPETFAFEVTGVNTGGVRGKLTNFYNAPAKIPLKNLSDRMKLSATEVGQVYDVRITDMNTVMMGVEVEVVGGLDPAPASAARAEEPTVEL